MSRPTLGTRSKFLFAFLTLVFFYLMLEGAAFVAQGLPLHHLRPIPEGLQLNAINRPCLSFDLRMLGRWDEGPCRIVRVRDGVKVFDQVFRGNNAGVPSRYQYAYQKPSVDVKRIVVFGDSFSIGHFLEVSWPDRLQQLLNEQEGERRYEVYNFSVNAGGLRNWHHTFFHEIVPRYEFDAIIIASFADDLNRALTLWHGDERGLLVGRFEEPAPSSPSEFSKNFLPRMKVRYAAGSDEKLDRAVRDLTRADRGWKLPPPDLYGFRFFAERWKNFTRPLPRILIATTDLSEAFVSMSSLELEALYRPIPLLWEMLDYCQEHRLPVLLATVPSIEGATRLADANGKGFNQHQRELMSISRLFNVSYFDGYGVFSGISPSGAIKRDYWLPNDGHWGQRGSDLFVTRLHGHLLSEGWLH